MGDGLCVQMSWVSGPVQSRVQPISGFKVLGGGRVRPALSRVSGLCSVGKRSARVGCVKWASPQARYSGSSDGEESDSEGRSWWSPRDEFGLYPWDPSWDSPDRDDADWVREDTFTFFTTDGLVHIGGSIRPSFERKQSRLRRRRYREEDYMDPKQGLCLGAIFDIAATNGLDRGRRFCVFGFCRSIEMLNDVVEDTVLDLGGEVVIAEKATTEGLHEKLTMTVVMPLLWGVPPAVDTLNYAIRSGGGIVEKTYKQWHFL
ncbi:hypothetical protein KC19_5G034800 [Ceratodon purpureus]|uniref:DUF7811 domain-containing protein n=1 Tax=Ceratodon purpureus TaxID=3225 RepID=A0A8T0HYA1_CERPU|nr:hypothetical protein KC19_5G034800 [Ceratodon purpureus]